MDWLPAGWENVALKVLMVVAVIVLAILAWRLLEKALIGGKNSDKDRRVGLTIFRNIVRVALWTWALCEVADICFGIDMAGVIGALGIMGIAISLGAQQTIANIIGGIIVSFSSTFEIGDWIVIEGHKEGRLVDTNWRSTTLQDEDGIIHEVPNSVMVSSIVIKACPYLTFVIPFALRTVTPNVSDLLRECEQVIFDTQVENGSDYKGMRPIVYISGTSLGAIEVHARLFANRKFSTYGVKRAVFPALINLLQEKDALAEDPRGWTCEQVAVARNIPPDVCVPTTADACERPQSEA